MNKAMVRTRQNKRKGFSKIAMPPWQWHKNATSFPKNHMSPWTDRGKKAQPVFQKTICPLGRARRGLDRGLAMSRGLDIHNSLSISVINFFAGDASKRAHVIYIEVYPKRERREIYIQDTLLWETTLPVCPLTHTLTRGNQHEQ